MQQINIGHCEEWAYLVADTYKGGEQALFTTYHKLNLENPKLAKEELLIHCKFLNADELFTNYLMMVFDEKLDLEYPIKRTNKYVIIYKKQVKLGKSPVYAHQYADLLTSKKYTEDYCHSFAKYYVYSLSTGQTKKEALLYASQYIESNNVYGFKNLKDRLLESYRNYYLDKEMTAKEISNQVDKKNAFFKLG
jgi:hypothetical protein